MILPSYKNLPIRKIASVFNHTTATYKFYWFLSILELHKRKGNKIKKIDLFSQMVVEPWYTVNYFQLSFGQHDLLQDYIQKYKSKLSLSINEKKENLKQLILSDENSKKDLSHFNNNVPHKFLSPWYSSKRKAEIYSLSQKLVDNPIYSIFEDYIIISSDWSEYLRFHEKILKDYCYWNLSLFLQKRNPSIPGIQNKLIKPAKRNSLSSLRNNYWSIYLAKKNVRCIFTDKSLNPENYELDHFVPYSFVTHDLMWNLIPIDKSFNSSKSNKLPNLNKHFKAFFEIQKDAFFTVQEKNAKKFKDDYLLLFKKLETKDDFKFELFRNTISPLISVAKNNGFEELN